MTRLLTSIKAGPTGWTPTAHTHSERKRRHRHSINQTQQAECWREKKVRVLQEKAIQDKERRNVSGHIEQEDP